MRKKKNYKLLWPTSKCCLKKKIDLDVVVKHGSIIVLLMMISSQLLNILLKQNLMMSLVSIVVNIYFLMAVLTKLEIINFSIFSQNLDKVFKFMFWIFLLNSFAYFVSRVQIHNYLFAPLNFLGAYFIFVLSRTR